MAKILQRELVDLKKLILAQGALVEERVHMASTAVRKKDAEAAEDIIKRDVEIDEKEVTIEEECLKILALHQPVANDLRYIVAVIKINNDLERIGDQAKNIAQRVKSISKNTQADYTFDYTDMSEKVQIMLKKSLDALVNFDTELALNVCEMDDEVDSIKNTAYDQIKRNMCSSPEKVGYFINLFLISRHLERIADHATNIAEEVIYMTEGEIVRHGKYMK